MTADYNLHIHTFAKLRHVLDTSYTGLVDALHLWHYHLQGVMINDNIVLLRSFSHYLHPFHQLRTAYRVPLPLHITSISCSRSTLPRPHLAARCSSSTPSPAAAALLIGRATQPSAPVQPIVPRLRSGRLENITNRFPLAITAVAVVQPYAPLSLLASRRPQCGQSLCAMAGFKPKAPSRRGGYVSFVVLRASYLGRRKQTGRTEL